MKKYKVEIALSLKELIALARFQNLESVDYHGYELEFEQYPDNETNLKVEQYIIKAFKAAAKAAKEQWDISNDEKSKETK